MRRSVAPFMFFVGMFTLASGLIAAPPEWTKEMPWYDQSKEDYKQYNEKDIRPFLDQQPRKRETRRGSVPDMSLFLYVAIALLIGAALYFIVRAYLERAARPKEKTSGEEIVVSVLEERHELSTVEINLRTTIEQLLAAGKYRRAGMLLFQFTLERLSESHLIEFSPDQTPREIQKSVPADEAAASLLLEAARVFEDCAYRPTEPDAGAVRALKERAFGFTSSLSA